MILERIRGFAADRGGNVALLFALSLPLVVGAGAFGVETTYWYYKRLEMQSAADAAAHAGALERRSGSGEAEVQEVGIQTAVDNGVTEDDADITVNAPPLSGPSAGGDAVEVIITADEARVFTRLFGAGPVEISVRSVASFSTAASACILALDPAASNAASFAGNTNVTLTGCSVMANSVAADAVNLQGSAGLVVDCLISAGGVSVTANLTMTGCPAPITSAPQVGDPFADLIAPTSAGGCQANNGGTRQPGRYCNGMNLSGTVHLQPGVYIIEASDFRVNANAYVTGTDVTIYLSGNARLSFNGNSETHLSAPTSGPYSGVLFFGDRNSAGSNNTINGNNSSILTGAIYFASQPVRYLGNFSGTSGCTQVVARTIEWSGSTTVAADCTALGMRALPAYNVVQLTE